MKLPRDISGEALVRGLRRVDYDVTRQKGSHVWLTTQRNGEHHVSVPLHYPIKVGTLAAILTAVGDHLGMDRQSLLETLQL